MFVKCPITVNLGLNVEIHLENCPKKMSYLNTSSEYSDKLFNQWNREFMLYQHNVSFNIKCLVYYMWFFAQGLYTFLKEETLYLQLCLLLGVSQSINKSLCVDSFLQKQVETNHSRKGKKSKTYTNKSIFMHGSHACTL